MQILYLIVSVVVAYVVVKTLVIVFAWRCTGNISVKMPLYNFLAGNEKPNPGIWGTAAELLKHVIL